MDMLSKVGGAILAAENDWSPKSGVAKERAMAMAAVEAMRDASNEMLEAMHEAMFTDRFTGAELPMLGAGFEAAINAALSPSPPTP